MWRKSPTPSPSGTAVTAITRCLRDTDLLLMWKLAWLNEHILDSDFVLDSILLSFSSVGTLVLPNR